jgi:hypothetical protein
MRYRVTWGDESSVVEADSEPAAWCAFVDHSEKATKCPNAHERKIEVVEDVKLVEVPVETKTVVVDEQCPPAPKTSKPASTPSPRASRA